ncbi:MAG: hypothetical protein DHS20C10_06410 [marine bacterium B5-7]|nr:MAG: hypothetical protein DHS20C10_06410 [marine bacterium B5-7]
MPVSTTKVLLSASEADFSRPSFLNQFTLDTWGEALPSGLTPLHLLAERGGEKGQAKIMQCLKAADVSSRMQVQRFFEQIFSPTVTDQKCPIAMEPVCLDDGVIYGASNKEGQVYFGYLKNGQVLLDLLSRNAGQRCPLSRLPIKWAMYLRDLPEEIRCILVGPPENDSASLKPINDREAFRAMQGVEAESFYQRLMASGLSNSLLLKEQGMNRYQIEKGGGLSSLEGSSPLTLFGAEDLVQLLSLLYGEDFSHGAGLGLIRAMNARRPEAAGSWADISAWVRLNEIAEGLAVMEKLLLTPWFMAALAADEILRKAFIATMTACRPDEASSQANVSVFCLLSETALGVAVMEKLLSTAWFMDVLAADEILRKAFIAMMMARLSKAAGEWANVSAWYLLSRTVGGTAVIAQLLGRRWFMETLAADAGLRKAFIRTMMARRPAAAGTGANVSAWLLLSESAKGTAVIAQLLGSPWFMETLQADVTLLQDFTATLCQLFQNQLFVDVAKDNTVLQEALIPLSTTICRELRALENSDATAYHRAMVGLSQLTVLYAKISSATQPNNASFFGDGRKRSADTAGGSEEGNEPNKRSRAEDGPGPSRT